MVQYIFDGSFEGLLTAIFDWYDLKHQLVVLENAKTFQPQMLAAQHEVITDEKKAERVWNGLGKKLSANWRNSFYCAYLSEDIEVHRQCMAFAKYIFDNPDGAEGNFAHAAVLAVADAQKKVNRERHRMKAFVRFTKTSDGIYYAPIEPDFNVMPLLCSFFKDRYADQQWIIYDVRRNFGMYYDLHALSQVVFEDAAPGALLHSEAPLSLDPSEELYSLLWKDYFRSTNITARKNLKLHIRHVPKRYWKYLTEKRI